VESLTYAASLFFRGSAHSDAGGIGVLVALFLVLLFCLFSGVPKTRGRSGTGGSVGRPGGTNPPSEWQGWRRSPGGMSLVISGGTSPQKVASTAPLREVPRESGSPLGSRAEGGPHEGPHEILPSTGEPRIRLLGGTEPTHPPLVLGSPKSVVQGEGKSGGGNMPTTTQGTVAVASSVASHVKSAFPKTTFEVYSHHADLIHVAWRGTPQTDEVRSYLQTLRLQRQIPNVDFNFHHTDPEEPSGPSASAGTDHVGESLSRLDQSLREGVGEWCRGWRWGIARRIGGKGENQKGNLGTDR